MRYIDESMPILTTKEASRYTGLAESTLKQ